MANEFNLLVRKPNGEPLPGAKLRVLNSDTGQDFTDRFVNYWTNVGNPIDPITDAYGKIYAPYLFEFGANLPRGTYALQLTADGYLFREFYPPPPNTAWNGTGDFDIMMQRQTFAQDQYQADKPSPYCSPLVPIVFTVTSTTGKSNERIQAKVTHSSGISSLMSVPVNLEGKARIDIRNRIYLDALPTIVPDAKLTELDKHFSDLVTVEMSTADPDGSLVIPISDEDIVTTDNAFMSLYVANLKPPISENNLGVYVGDGEFIGKWICVKNPVAYRGYYFDIAVWLLLNPVTSYQVISEYLDQRGNVVDTDTIPMAVSPYVQKVRVKTNDLDDLVVKVRLTVKDGSAIVVEPITIVYK